MALSYKGRKRLSLFLLLVWLPAYIIFVVGLIGQFPPLPKWVQFPLYVFLGVAWAFPFKFAFMGIGKDDPDAEPTDEQ